MIIDVYELRQMEKDDGTQLNGLENLDQRCQRLHDFLLKKYNLKTSWISMQGYEDFQSVAFTDGGYDDNEKLLFNVYFTPMIKLGISVERVEL